MVTPPAPPFCRDADDKCLVFEQVVHHPTIMAAYAQGRKWHVIGDGELRSKFLGPSIQLRPVGIMQLTFHDGDDFTWHKVTYCKFKSAFA